MVKAVPGSSTDKKLIDRRGVSSTGSPSPLSSRVTVTALLLGLLTSALTDTPSTTSLPFCTSTCTLGTSGCVTTALDKCGVRVTGGPTDSSGSDSGRDVTTRVTEVAALLVGVSCIVQMPGCVIRGQKRPSSLINMHLSIYTNYVICAM